MVSENYKQNHSNLEKFVPPKITEHERRKLPRAVIALAQ